MRGNYQAAGGAERPDCGLQASTEELPQVPVVI